MTDKEYYSVRTGKHTPRPKQDLGMLIRMFLMIYDRFVWENYFIQAFGIYYYDDMLIHEGNGYLYWDMDAVIFEHLKKTNLWPIQEKCFSYSEDDLFDMIEFLFDHVSKPQEHLNLRVDYDRKAGRQEFRTKINELLRDYKDGYEISEDGTILTIPDTGLETLLEAQLPSYDPENIDSRLAEAVQKFRNRHSSLDDRRDAIRSLVDVLEFLRPQLQAILTRKDESDLFQIANKFGIRHHNINQQTDYDKPIWYSWMFYYYLATIHACLRLIDKENESKS